MKLEDMLPILRDMQLAIRDAVVASCEAQAIEQLSSIAAEEAGDTIYAIDKVSEELLIEWVDSRIATKAEPIILIAEGLPEGQVILPKGAKAEDADWRIIVDPIDGTRGLMYQKRSAWILTGVAANKGPATNLQDIELALQTEIPLVKQHLCDHFWAIRGQGAKAERHNRLDGNIQNLRLTPSQADTVAHGFAMISRFFPGARDALAAVDEALITALLGDVQPGKAHCFEDQYISSGGQFAEMLLGHDRFNADLRPLAEQELTKAGRVLGICCHPYDVCTELIAAEAGVCIRKPDGGLLDCPLDVEADVAWTAYANATLHQQIEPVLQDILQQRGWMTGPA